MKKKKNSEGETMSTLKKGLGALVAASAIARTASADWQEGGIIASAYDPAEKNHG